MSELTREVRDMRVAVAKDVIERLDAQKIIAEKGVYVGLVPSGDATAAKDGDLRDFLAENHEPCKVCAIGAAVVSKAWLYDNVPMRSFTYRVESWFGRHTLMNTKAHSVGSLAEVFDPVTLDRLEAAYEKTASWATAQDMTHDNLQPYVEYGRQFDTRADRLRAIYQNIIDHDGEFVVS